ncbi:uncharacterized protein Nmag_0854 [Natrialba magadii ATCC 43099]|uniref:Uncharacterized protein n=1 Tax=Natrialba magadii (strain ATCC 43099 / DSM 3394 / CCM 3739 / CIP 104546 / IAM 13178 / JCM 8861 / NBRC 102185 / NCIMB 2190 / MS3) TaxID=547559 RepID=D3T080_NATMM|nr:MULTISPECIES: hypothetical protein [Natrialba]ADD04438.1 uncharacterized protein Nmag_0854 [Natrialba magadii ATCC 43099]ELY25834.1 hypothetical protein C500_16789 [Natrialba magadii ATCC 43099]OIB56758.1 hypothetical protein BBD46_16280 [Natrialba sp. SSL1]
MSDRDSNLDPDAGTDQDPTEKPTHDAEEAQQEGAQMARNWIAIAVVSILVLLLLVIGMMQATGLVDVFAPIADTQTQQWGAFAVLALIVLAIAGWSWTTLAR